MSVNEQLAQSIIDEWERDGLAAATAQLDELFRAHAVLLGEEKLSPTERPTELESVEVMRLPVLSTAHLTAEEGARHSADWPTHCLESEHGFVVYFGTFYQLRESIEVHAGAPDACEQWAGFLHCAKWAEARGFEWIRFDSDGEKRDDLHAYEW